MSYSPADAEAIAKKIRYDLTAAQAKLTDLMNCIAELAAQLPEQGDAILCPHCGLGFNVTTIGQQRLADHIANVHGVSGSGRVKLDDGLTPVETSPLMARDELEQTA